MYVYICTRSSRSEWSSSGRVQRLGLRIVEGRGSRFESHRSRAEGSGFRVKGRGLRIWSGRASSPYVIVGARDLGARSDTRAANATSARCIGVLFGSHVRYKPDATGNIHIPFAQFVPKPSSTAIRSWSASAASKTRCDAEDGAPDQ